MENVIHRLTLDLTGADMMPRVEVQQDNARSIAISLTQGGRPYWIAEGVTAVFSGRKPDGMPLFNACTIEKNRVRYDFTDQTTNVPGIVECEILLYDSGGKLLASPRFELAIDELIHRDGDVPESAPEINALTEMVSAGTELIRDLSDVKTGLEPIRAEIAANAGRAEEAAEEARQSAGYAEKYASTARQAEEVTNELLTAAEAARDDAALSAQKAESAAERAEAAAEKAATGGGGDPYIASDEPPEDTDALWINTSEPKEAVALGVTAVETVEGVELYATDELGTTKGLVRHGKDGAPGEKGDPGEPGRTPVKGEDYFTPSEIEDVARQAAEMVEVPEGGGGGEFSYFIATIDEDATYFTVTEDAEGTPLKFTEAYISVTAARSAEATTNGAMGVGLTEWLNSFNSKAIFYNMSLMADAYRYMLHVKTDGGMLTARMMGDIRCAANIGAAKPMLTAVSGAQMGYSAMQHTTAQSARFTPASLAIAYGNIYNGETAESPMVIDGAMHTVTIGVDIANAVKIGAGSFVEVWYR